MCRPAQLLSALVLALALVACTESASRGSPDGGAPPVPPDAGVCPPIACGPLPEGCTAGPPAVPCGCATAVCPPGCAIDCAAPPPGCRYEGGVFEGPCERLTCGTLVCDPGPPTCAIDCAAPPPGCHLEGALTEGPCELLTCGTLVCDPPPPTGSCPLDHGAGPCCARTTTTAPGRIDLRVVGLAFDAPVAFANATIQGLLQGALDADRLNWLIRIEPPSGPAEAFLRTADGEPSGAGFRARPPIVGMNAAGMGTSWGGGPADTLLALRVLNDDGSSLMTLPFDGSTFDTLPLSDDLLCMGARAGRRWELPGAFRAVIRVSDARSSFIEPLGMDLCSLLAGASCDGAPAGWRTPPDVACSAGLECSGWSVEARLAAAATPLEGF